MLNFMPNSATLLGLFLMVSGAGLYFLRSMRPELSRDYDIFFAAAGLVCGAILLFYGWILTPVLQVGVLLLAGSTGFFAVEAIRLRGVSTEKARRNTRVVDRDRPVSRTRVYQEAELDRIESYDREANYDSPMLRGYQEPPRRSRRAAPPLAEERRNPRSRSRSDRYGYEETTSKRRSSRNNSPQSDRYDGWDENSARWEERPKASPNPPRRSSSRNDYNDYSNPDYSTRVSRNSRRSRSDKQPPTGRNYRPLPTDVDYYPLNDLDHPDRDRY